MIRIEGISQLRINVKPAARVDALQDISASVLQSS